MPARRTGGVYANGTKPCLNCSEEYVQPLSYKKIVIIVAYRRTGSSLTGAILSKHPGSLYVFEPLRNLAKIFQNTPNNETTQIVYPHGFARFVLSVYKKRNSIALMLMRFYFFWKKNSANGKTLIK